VKDWSSLLITALTPIREQQGGCLHAPTIYDDYMESALLDLTLPTLAENLALDEALLLEAEAGRDGEVLRFWEWPGPAVVLGAGSKLHTDVDVDACERDGVPILRRASGGGTVLLGPGCLLFSLVLRFDRAPALRDVNASYRYILGRIVGALQPLAALECAGISDMAVAGRKCSGNAQQRKSQCLLHHGTLLYGFDLAQIGRYLRPPENQPAYREGRPHLEFVANLPAAAADLKRLLALEWGAAGRADLPASQVAELVAQKYSLVEWNRRR
jgi:lipoate---protein ligase